jgi:cytochrome b6-f complex iron-sulfur subunit
MNPTRRTFLKTCSATAAVIGVGGVATLTTGCGANIPKTEFPAGELGKYPAGKLTRVGEDDVFIFHDADKGFGAISGKCTHWGCGVEENPEEGNLKCGCHGSRFSLTGDLIEGPAERPLDWLSLKIDNGKLSVDPSKTVPAGTFVKA